MFQTIIPLSEAATVKAGPGTIYEGQATGQDGKKERLLLFCKEPKTREEMQEYLGVSSRAHFTKEYLNPLLRDNLIKITIPDKPNSPKQKYVTV